MARTYRKFYRRKFRKSYRVGKKATRKAYRKFAKKVRRVIKKQAEKYTRVNKIQFGFKAADETQKAWVPVWNDFGSPRTVFWTTETNISRGNDGGYVEVDVTRVNRATGGIVWNQQFAQNPNYTFMKGKTCVSLSVSFRFHIEIGFFNDTNPITAAESRNFQLGYSGTDSDFALPATLLLCQAAAGQDDDDANTYIRATDTVSMYMQPLNPSRVKILKRTDFVLNAANTMKTIRWKIKRNKKVSLSTIANGNQDETQMAQGKLFLVFQSLRLLSSENANFAYAPCISGYIRERFMDNM